MRDLFLRIPTLISNDEDLLAVGLIVANAPVCGTIT